MQPYILHVVCPKIQVQFYFRLRIAVHIYNFNVCGRVSTSLSIYQFFTFSSFLQTPYSGDGSDSGKLVDWDSLYNTHHSIFMEFLNSIKSLSNCSHVLLRECLRCKASAFGCKNSLSAFLCCQYNYLYPWSDIHSKIFNVITIPV